MAGQRRAAVVPVQSETDDGVRGNRTMIAPHRHYQHVGAYLALCRRALAFTNAGGRVRLFWNSDYLDLDGWRREFCRALHRRINAKAGGLPNGRRWQEPFQTELVRDCQWLREISASGWRLRAIPRFSTDIVQRRFGHLIHA